MCNICYVFTIKFLSDRKLYCSCCCRKKRGSNVGLISIPALYLGVRLVSRIKDVWSEKHLRKVSVKAVRPQRLSQPRQ